MDSMNKYGTDDLNGKILKSVAVSDDKERLTLTFKDDSVVVFRTEADCCSSTWIEHLTAPDDLAGAEITRVYDGDSVDLGEQGGEYSGEYIAVYQTHFDTTKGTVSVEYRNSSNGYYGGSLERVTE